MRYPHVPEQHQVLLADWEARLREEPDYYHTCAACDLPLPAAGSRGPRRIYCSDRCRRAAARQRAEAADQDFWGPSATAGDLEHEDGWYVDAFPGDHPPLNAPVVPRDAERTDWAFEIVGQPDGRPGWDFERKGGLQLWRLPAHSPENPPTVINIPPPLRQQLA